MTLKITIGFVLSTLLLVLFEYIFLQELFSNQRALIILTSLAGVGLAALFFFLFFTRYRKTIKDS